MTGIPEAFFAAIIANPDDPQPRAVLADWLLEHEEPLGELIALSIAGRNPDRMRALERATGGLEGWTVGWRWGFIEQLATTLMQRGPGADELAVLASPAARLLRTLSLDLYGAHPESVLAVLPSELRALSLWSFGPSYPGSLMVPWARLPHLRRLEAYAGGFLWPIVAPELEELVLAGCDLGVLAAAQLPALRVLHLELRAAPTDGELAAVLARLPTLRHLALHAQGLAKMKPPDAELDIFELVDDASFPHRRTLVVDRSPPAPCAALLWRQGAAARLLRLDPRRVSSVEIATIEWNGSDWWLRDANAWLNRSACRQVPLRDGDELVDSRTIVRFIAAGSEPELATRVAAMCSRYGLRIE